MPDITRFIPDGGIATAKIADGAVTEAKISSTTLTGAGSTLDALAGALSPTPVAYQESGTPASVASDATSTFSGWGMPVGTPAAFNRIEFDLYPWDSAALPTWVRIRVRATDNAGPILADQSTTIALRLNEFNRVTVDLGSTVGDGATQLWVEWFTNGKCGHRQATSNPYTGGSYPGARYSTGTNLALPSLNGTGTSRLTWFRYSMGPVTAIAVSDDPDYSAGGFPYSSGSFTGWGNPVGVQQNFNRIEFDIRPIDAAYPVTKLRCRVLTTDGAGTVLADKAISVSTTYAQPARIAVDFDSPIANANGLPLWVEWYTDGRASFLQAANTYRYNTPTYPVRKYTLSASVNTVVWANSTVDNAYFRFLSVNRGASRFGGAVDLKASLRNAVNSLYTPTILLPATLYACEGRELALYWDSILQAPLGATASDYAVNVTCTKGRQENNRWAYTPAAADAGTTTLQLDVYYAGNLVTTKTVSLVTKALAGAGVSRKLLVIGDSTTANGYWLSEMANLCATAGPITLTTVGTLSATANDAGSTPRTVKHEAISGKTVAYWYADPASPFLNAGAFNFPAYNTALGADAVAANDWVLIHLGINDVFNITSDATLAGTVATMQAQLQAMVTSILAVTGVRVGIMLTIPPPADQNGFALSYTTGQTRARYKVNRDAVVAMLLSTFTGQANVYLIPTSGIIDIYNNFPTTATAVNARNAATVPLANNGVHPAPSGYWQIADQVYTFLRGQES